MNDRRFSICLLILAWVYGVSALSLKIAFSYDPLGPKPVPLVLSSVLFLVCSLILLHPLQPDSGSSQNPFRIFVILLFYWISFLPLGFLLSTTISCYLTARQFKCTWMQGLMAAMVISVTGYGFFALVLHIQLPLGYIFGA